MNQIININKDDDWIPNDKNNDSNDFEDEDRNENSEDDSTLNSNSEDDNYITIHLKNENETDSEDIKELSVDKVKNKLGIEIEDKGNLKNENDDEKTLLESMTLPTSFNPSEIMDLVNQKKYDEILYMIEEHRKNYKVRFPIINEELWENLIDYIEDESNHLFYQNKYHIFIKEVEKLIPYMDLENKFKKKWEILNLKLDNSKMNYLELQSLYFNFKRKDNLEIFLKKILPSPCNINFPKKIFKKPNIYHAIYLCHCEDSITYIRKYLPKKNK